MGDFNKDVFVVRDFKVIAAFRDSNPGQTFQPIPPESNRTPRDGDKICKFWLNTGKCPREGNCPFEHIQDVAQLTQLRGEFVQKLQERRALLGHHDLDTVVSRHKRAELFADFILNNLPVDTGDVVLDVAGGRGDLAFELAIKRGFVNVVTIDPRPERIKRWQRKLLVKKSDSKLPRHVQGFFDEEVAFDFKPHLILGLHPDEATEVIVDVALRLKVAFAVVPCCVFANKFKGQRGGGDSEPKTYEEWIEYLQKKHSAIRERHLGFRGRDKVLFWLPYE